MSGAVAAVPFIWVRLLFGLSFVSAPAKFPEPGAQRAMPQSIGLSRAKVTPDSKRREAAT